MKMNYWVWILVAGCLFTACSDLPEDRKGLEEVIKESEELALTARREGKAGDGEAAADRAADAFKAIKDRTDETSVSEEELKTLDATVRRTRRIANLAMQEKERNAAVDGTKGKIYRSVRGVALKTVTVVLANACLEMSEGGEVSDFVKQSADIGVEFAVSMGKDLKLETGERDWKATAGALKLLGEEPPGEMSVYLAIAFVFGVQNKLALFEIELADQEKISKTSMKQTEIFFEGMIYSLNGWSELGAESCDRLCKDGDGGEIVGLSHLLLAYIYGKEERNYKEADRHLALSMKACPNNPLTVVITGERLAADGSVEKSAQSLEECAKKVEDKALAKLIVDKAKRLRDGKDNDASLFIDSDFIIPALKVYLSHKAKDSPKAAALLQKINSATAFGERILKYLPGS